MPGGISTELKVQRKTRDGWFVYTCDVLPGLYVASMDDRRAFNDLPRAIATLLRLDLNVECVVTHKLQYDEFLRMVSLKERAANAVKELTSELVNRGADLTFTVQHTENRPHDRAEGCH